MFLSRRALRQRAPFLVLALSFAIALLILLQAGLANAAPTARLGPDDGPYQAAVVVDFGDGSNLIRHINFPTPTISGLQALRLTGLDLGIAEYSFGAAICSIEGVGCPASNCFCNANKYWGYQSWQNDSWQGYAIGPADSTVADGAVEGWVWGAFGSAPPPVQPAGLAASAALQWLHQRQADDGSYGHNAGATLDVVLSLAAGNQDPAGWISVAGNSPLDFLHDSGPTFAGFSPAAAGKLALGVAAADQDPLDFAGLNLAISLTQRYNPATGAFGDNNQDQSLAMLGLRAAGEAIPAAAAQRLADTANAAGGWGWTAGQPSDVDSTSMALQALIAAGQPPTATAVLGGLAYLRDVQLTNDDGGFAHSPDLAWGTESNTNSSAMAIQAILAAGQDPLSAAWSVGATQPISYLLGQQQPDGGFAWVDPPSDPFATQQVVPGLTGKPYPYLSRSVAQRKALDWIAGQQQADGSFAGFGAGATVDAVLAIAATGADPNSFISPAGNTALDFLASQAATFAAQGVSAAGKLAVGAAAAGRNLRNFGGVDLVAAIQGAYSDGQYGTGDPWDQAWAMLGLAAAGHSAPVSATQHLADSRAASGGWGFIANADHADVDSTGLALQALAAAGAGRDDEAGQAGLAFLRSLQNGDGGFPGFLGSSDPASTGLALQALAAFGENPRGLDWTTTISDGSASRLTIHTPQDAILALQNQEGGFPGFSGPSDPFSTYQAVPGIAGQPLPLARQLKRYFPLIIQ